MLYWVNNELEFEYDGASWRVWRNAAPATQMKVYRNGVLSATVDATYQGSDVSELRYAKSGHWMDINTSGVILDSDAGWDSDGGGDGGGDPCAECPPDGEPCLPCSGLMSGDDCTDERNDGN